MLTPRVYTEIPQRYRLEANKCKACGKVFFPPRLVCTCGSQDFEPYRLPTRGKIVTYTVVRTPGFVFKLQKPIVLAIVELEDGTRIMAQVTDLPPVVEDYSEIIKIGAEVELVFRKIFSEQEAGIHVYGYKCRLI
ncbi:MAG: Zn-ribbon domain-containing OB-fold protein [Thermosulfidibacteraceae bacterium]|jgi:uncharacterized OB-fold protein